MIVGVGTPCLYRDRYILRNLTKSVFNLKKYDNQVIQFVHFNDGTEGLRKAREKVFDSLFGWDCEVVIQASADFYLFPNILTFIEKDRVVSFTFLKRRISTFIEVIKFLIAPNPWTGCYSIPRKIWVDLKKSEMFDGTDTSVNEFCKRNKIVIKRIRLPKYYVLRYSDRMIEFAKSLPFHKRIMKLLGAW